MKTFYLYWLTGKKEKVQGNNIADAMTLAGYNQGALDVLDFFSKTDDNSYYWSKNLSTWIKITRKKEDRNWRFSTHHTLTYDEAREAQIQMHYHPNGYGLHNHEITDKGTT